MASDTEETVNWGALLRKLRRERKWSQQELAEALGVTLVSVARWENGVNRPNRPAQVLIERIQQG